MVNERDSDSLRSIAMGVLKICLLVLVLKEYYVSAQTKSYKCDFEQGSICSFLANIKGNKENWRIGRGKLNAADTGPSVDHTTGTGNYVVFSTKNKSPGSEANLECEFSPPNEKEVCLTFFYYMSGKDLGTLKVVRREENVTESTLWLMTDDQGNMWKRGMAVLKPSILYNQVVFSGVTGKGSRGFMALDDIRIREGENCQLLPPEADPRFEDVAKLACTFDDKNLCSWTQDKTTLSWKFGTGTSLDSTGPKQPVGGKGQYIYISSYEGTQSNNEKIARLQSAVVTSFYPDAACFSFYYHMFGVHVGELRVILVPMRDDKTPLGRQVIWRRRGTQPDKWLQFKDSLNVTGGDYRIEIEAEGGSGFAGDIAIDEIMLNLGACPGVELCDFESGLCGWTIEGSSQGRFSWQRGVQLPKGPSQDHTTMTDVGYYLQAVATDGAQAEEKTSLVSPKFDKRWGPHCVTFWYYRPGLSTGKISVLTRQNDQETLQWSATRDVGKFWHYGQITIHEKKSLQLVFQAEKGPRNENEMALDDIEIKNSACGETAECNFNNNYCSYFLNETSDFAWLLGTGRVVNIQFVDKTPADNSVENGMYIYTDMTSPSLKENQQAVLMSEILEVPVKAFSCLTFYYHLNGKDSSTLSVGKATLGNTDKDMKYNVQEVYSTTDKTGGGWTKKSVDFAGNQGTTYQLYFKATRGKGPRAFIAVDDISVKEGPCVAPPTPTPASTTEMPVTSVTCSFDNNNFCSWKADSGELKWKISDTKAIKGKMPKFDHTYGNYMGRYVYLRGDDIATKEGTLTSAQADQEWDGNFCVSFWYFMNVEGVNSLELTAEHNSNWWNMDYVSFWKREGNYGYKWRHAYVHIKSNKISPKLRFIGKVKTGVIALDDITAMGGSCPPSKMCTFDDNDDMCGYTQDSKNSVNWDVKSGEDNDTLTRMPDHTTNSIEGNYLYIGFKVEPLGSTQSSRIYSPKHSPTDGSCVTFYYHIYNVSTLSLNTYLSTDNGLSVPQWSVTIGQGLLWHGARFTVASKSLSWQVVFEVNVGSRGYGQVAIDDILISNGVCPDQGYCDFETEDCLWENVRAPFDPNTREFYAPDGRRNALPQRADVNKDLLKDDMDWVRHIGEDYFGPSRDHTLQSPQGFYLLLDPRSSTEGKKAVYVSERLRTSGGVCFKFWYSVPNYKVSSNLILYASSDFKTANQVTIISDNTNEVWTQSLVTVIPPITSDSPVVYFWIFLAGMTGNHTLGYIAIDDISVGDNACEGPCAVNPCLNEGICSVKENSFKCDCPRPFFGEKCEEDPCTVNPCLNDGNCSVKENSFKCDCLKPFFGEKCEEDPCTVNPCLNDGNCSVKENSFKCDCLKPFFGEKCEEDPCTVNPCRNNGNCSVKGKSFKCDCPWPFFGDRCEEDPCTLNPCLNNGICSVKRNTFECDCPRPFFGEKCEKDPCTLNPCLHNGICSVKRNTFECDCPRPFFGEKCEEDPCTSNPCLNDGVCRVDGDNFKCYCPRPFFGDRCEEGICNDDVCVHGKCEIIGKYYRCRCDDGFTGLRCEDRIQTKSDKQVLWQIIQTSIMFFMVLLLSGMFCLLLRRRK